MTKKNIYHLLAKHFQKIAHPDEEKLITVFREKNPLEYQLYSVFISAPNLEFIMNEHDTTVMQLPHEVSSFF